MPDACGRGRGGGLLLLFHFLDQLVERRDHAVFDLAHLRTGAPQVEPAANVVHPPRDVIERLVLETFQVGLHQPGHRNVALG